MRPHLYLLADGEVVVTEDLHAWGRWFERSRRDGTCRVAVEDLAPGVQVSTVFLGLNYGFGDEGPPVLWETLVFAPVDQPWSGAMVRYTSRADAEAGHATMVDRVTRGLAELAASIKEAGAL